MSKIGHFKVRGGGVMSSGVYVLGGIHVYGKGGGGGGGSALLPYWLHVLIDGIGYME